MEAFEEYLAHINNLQHQHFSENRKKITKLNGG